MITHLNMGVGEKKSFNLNEEKWAHWKVVNIKAMSKMYGTELEHSIKDGVVTFTCVGKCEARYGENGTHGKRSYRTVYALLEEINEKLDRLL